MKVLPLCLLMLMVTMCEGSGSDWILLGIDMVHQQAVVRKIRRREQTGYRPASLKKQQPVEIYSDGGVGSSQSELVYAGGHTGLGSSETIHEGGTVTRTRNQRNLYSYNPHFFIEADFVGELTVIVFENEDHAGGFSQFSVSIDDRIRSVSVLDTETPPKLETVQEIGDPATQNNIVIVSGGYLETDEEQFNADAARAISVLQFGTASLNSAPWPRYFSTLNIYKIFEASSERGASMPHGKNHQIPKDIYCHDDKGCEPFSVSNNLDCSYGTPHQKLLYCDYEKVIALASYSPNPTVVIVLVNQEVYGGTGDPGPSGGNSPGVAAVYNGDSMDLVLVHELGHAFGELSDEYSYNIEETTDLKLKNCALDPKEQWSDFRDANFDIDLLHVNPCSYTNYFKPTSERCLMGRSYKSMCSVCLHEMSLSFYDVEPNLAAPRCPHPGEVIYLSRDDEVTLRINNEFTSFSDVSVEWVVPGNHSFTKAELTGSALLLRGSALNPGVHQVSVTIEDQSPLVVPVRRVAAMSSKQVFNIVRVSQSSDIPSSCSVKSCIGVGWEDPPYCSVCDPSKGVCNVSHVVHPKQYEGSAQADLDRAEQWIWTIGGVVFLAALMISTIVHAAITRHRNTVVQTVVILTPQMKKLHLATLIEIAVAIVVSILTLCIGIYYYDRLLVFGKGFLLAVLVLALFLFCSSFPLLLAVHLKHVRWVICNIVWLCLVAVAFLCTGSLILWVANNIGGDTLRTRLSEAWDDTVEENPEDVCLFQRSARCSGFIHSCSNVAGQKLPSYCPSNCEIGNRVPDPCYGELEEFVSENFRPVGIAVICCFVYLIVIMWSAIILSMAIQSRKNEMEKRRKYRLLGVTEPTLDSDDETADMTCPPLTDEEIEQLHIEFKKVDKNNNNTLDKQEAFLFWEVALGHPPTEYDIQTAEKFADTNGDGLISFEEFIALYQPFDHRHTTEESRTGDNEKEDNQVCIDPQIRGELTPADIRFLRSEFRRIDRGCGILSSRRQLKDWYQTLYGREPMDDEIEWFSATVDPENTGKVDFQGFCIPYKNQRKQLASQILSEIGRSEIRKLRRLFGDVNKGGDSVLTTFEEFSLMYEVFHGRSPPSSDDVEAFKNYLIGLNNGVVGFLEFCTPFSRRARRRKKMRQGLDPERIEAIRSHYLLLEKDANGNLAPLACSQLYSVLYEEVPSEDILGEFIKELDVEKVGMIGFDEILRLFAETARMTASKRWLQSQGVTAAETMMVENDFKVLSVIDDGLRMGVTLEGASALLRNTARSVGNAQPTPAQIRALFEAADEDGDGYLDEMEFTHLHYSSVLSLWKDAGVPLPVPMTIRTDLLSQPSQLTHLPNPLQESPGMNPLVTSAPHTPSVVPSHVM